MGEQERRIDEARWDRMVRISQRVASNLYQSPTPDFGMVQRFDAALDGVVAWVAEHGWPEDDVKPLFTAADLAVRQASHEARKHYRWGAFWLPLSGDPDRLAEDLTDRIGIHQLCWAFTPGEWAAVWGLAEAIRRGEGHDTAAALAGMHPGQYKQRLYTARKRARELWVAAGEHPRGRYTPLAGMASKAHRALQWRRAWTPEEQERDRERQLRRRAGRDAA